MPPRDSTILTSLPGSTVVRILSFLDYGDILHFKAVSRACRDLYRSNAYLQLLVQMGKSGVAEILCNPQIWGTTRLLAYLKKRDAIWLMYQTSELQVNLGNPQTDGFPEPSFWDLLREEEGLLITGYQSERSARDPFSELMQEACVSLDILRLAELNDDNCVAGDQPWRFWPFDEEIVQIGLALRQSDLVAFVTVKPQTASRGRGRSRGGSRATGRCVLKIHLRKFSTRENHPLAAQPVLTIVRFANPKRKLDYRVVINGPFLYLAYNDPNPDLGLNLSIWNWQTGERLSGSFYAHGYSFALLTYNVFVVTDGDNGLLKFFQIRIEGSEWTIHTLNSLALPRLLDDVEFVQVNTKRNFRHSVGAGIPTQDDGSWPFLRFAPEQEIISFVVEVRRPEGNHDVGVYLLTVHISTLLRLANMPTSGNRSNARPIPWERWGPTNTLFENLVRDDDWKYFHDNLGSRQVISFTAHALIREFNTGIVRHYKANPHLVRGSSIISIFDRPRVCTNTHFADTITTSLPYLQSKILDDGDNDGDNDDDNHSCRVYLEQDYFAYAEHPQDISGWNFFELRRFFPSA